MMVASPFDTVGDGRRLHVVMCAAACHPDVGSEFAVGWQWVTAAAKHHRVTVVTGDARGSADAICRRLQAEPELARNLSFRFVPWFDPPSSKLLQKLWKAVPPIYYWHYRRWLRDAANEMRRVIDQEAVDLVHQVTYICYREPGEIASLGVPFVWGPIGGTQDVPWAFLPSLGIYDGWRHAARNIINWCELRWRRDVKRTMRNAAALSAIGSHTQKAIRRIFRRESALIPATSCGHGLGGEPRRDNTGGARFVFSGLHIARKGLPFALDALGQLRNLDWSLDVLGTGPLTEAWKRRAATLGIADRVRFHGFLPRAVAVRVMAEADAFVFPSLQEGWPTVVIEALSLGLPVVTTGHHGMADMIDKTCGFLLRVDRPKHLIEDLVESLRILATDRETLMGLSAGAHRRAELFSRERQIDTIDQLYKNAMIKTNASS